jgi:hypothetical protein
MHGMDQQTHLTPTWHGPVDCCAMEQSSLACISSASQVVHSQAFPHCMFVSH